MLFKRLYLSPESASPKYVTNSGFPSILSSIRLASSSSVNEPLITIFGIELGVVSVSELVMKSPL